MKIKLERIKRKSGEKNPPVWLNGVDIALVMVLGIYLYYKRVTVGELLTSIMFLRVMWTIDAWLWG